MHTLLIVTVGFVVGAVSAHAYWVFVVLREMVRRA